MSSTSPNGKSQRPLFVNGKGVIPCKKVNLHERATLAYIDQLLLDKRKEIGFVLKEDRSSLNEEEGKD